MLYNMCVCIIYIIVCYLFLFPICTIILKKKQELKTKLVGVVCNMKTCTGGGTFFTTTFVDTSLCFTVCLCTNHCSNHNNCNNNINNEAIKKIVSTWKGEKGGKEGKGGVSKENEHLLNSACAAAILAESPCHAFNTLC